MATTYLSPGVYIEEVNAGIKPIQAVGTSTAAFVGITAEASVKRLNPATNTLDVVESRLNKATLVTSWLQYTQTFGGFLQDAYVPDAVYGYFANGGGPCYVVSVRAVHEADSSAVAASVSVSSAKGNSFSATAKAAGSGGNNYIVAVTHDKDAEGKPTGLFTVSVGGETKSGLSMKKTDPGYIGDAAFAAIAIGDVGTTTAIPDEGAYHLSGGGMPHLKAADFIGDVVERTGINGLEALDDIRLLCCPDLMSGYDGSDKAKEIIKVVQTEMIGFAERMRYTFALLDTPPGLNAQQAKDWRMYTNYDTSYAAMYYPWVRVADLSDSPNTTKLMPPSGHMVGVYNRVDSERGVHKAPANEILRGVVDLEIKLTRGEQDVLNPIGVNCIRTFPGRGIRAWGARTLSSDGSWRYINVRRLFILIEASMDIGLQWVVFEPNDRDLWQRVTRDVVTFLRMVWRNGALFGSSEDEAFYVKCDDELNSLEVREAGQLIIEVGVCPVKPAEFVIFRISQWAGPNAS